MKYFKSLNCCLCNLPFAPFAKQPKAKQRNRYPRKLKCGLAMCHECFENDKALKKEERKHQCSKGDGCFSNPNFAHFLIDVLSQDFIALMATKSGYVLSKPASRIECPICHEEYSLTESGRAPFDLNCNHTICEGCLPTIQQSCSRGVNYEVLCPTCQAKTVTKLRITNNSLKGIFDGSGGLFAACPNGGEETQTNLITRNNSLKEFLRELPEMIRQYEQGKMSTQKCSGCNTLYHIETMFNCSDCPAKICGACGIRNHQGHKFVDLILIEANRISSEVKDVATIKIGVYEKMFFELHNENKKIIDHLKSKLINEADQIKKIVRIQEVVKEQQEIEKLGDKFEAISEEYMPQIRGFNSKLQDLSRQLEK